MKLILTFLKIQATKILLAFEQLIWRVTKGKLARGCFLASVKTEKIENNVKIIKETDNSTFIAKINADGSYDNSDFKLLTTSDLHLDEDNDINHKTLTYLCEEIKKVSPDLVVFPGDVVLSKYQHIDCIQFAELMEKMGVYWAYVFGNHEAREEKEYFKYYILKSMSKYPHCLSKIGNSELFGYGNFIINVMNSDTQIKQSLFFFDSGRNVIEHHAEKDGVPADMREGNDYIKPSQIKWYEYEIQQLKSIYGEFKNMLFMHIPIPEYKLAVKLAADGDYLRDKNGDVLRNNDKTLPGNPSIEFICGKNYETISCSSYNSGLFKSMKKNNAAAIFCGHDHFNDFVIKVDGILLIYSQYGGYYIDPFYEEQNIPESEWQQGVTITTIKSTNEISIDKSYHKEIKID